MIIKCLFTEVHQLSPSSKMLSKYRMILVFHYHCITEFSYESQATTRVESFLKETSNL